MPTLETLWNHINVGAPTECWPWKGKPNDQGYSYTYYEGSLHSAHRLAYTAVNGPIPDGLVLDHTCHNDSGCDLSRDCPHRSCCNPAHLEAVTQAVNNARGQVSKRPVPTHCPKGHEYNEINTRVSVNKKGITIRNCRPCERVRMAARRAK